MYKVIGFPGSRTFRVLWMLEELGQPYDYDPAAPHSEAVRAVNPGGKIPALVTEEGPLWDSVAILTYLADRHGAMTHPAGSYARARQTALTMQIMDEFDAVLWVSARHSFILPEERRVPAIKDSLRWEFARNQTRLVRIVGGGDFVAGEAPTVPDIILAHCCNWARAAKFEVTEPWLVDFAERMRARPSFRKLAPLLRR